jgi:hypothetical protein
MTHGFIALTGIKLDARTIAGAAMKEIRPVMSERRLVSIIIMAR